MKEGLPAEATPEDVTPEEASRRAESPRNRKQPSRAAAPAEPDLPRAAADQLTEAERWLDRGDANEAIRHARQSFFVRKSSRGWALLTRAFCRKGDLENARASFRNIRRGSPERIRALRACRTADIDLR